MKKTYIYLSILLMIVLLSSAIVLLHKSSSGMRRAENPCNEEVIKSHILSLSKSYTDSEKEEMIPEIKKSLGCVR